MILIEFETNLDSGVVNILKYKSINEDKWHFLFIDIETLNLLITNFVNINNFFFHWLTWLEHHAQEWSALNVENTNLNNLGFGILVEQPSAFNVNDYGALVSQALSRPLLCSFFILFELVFSWFHFVV